MTRTLLSALTLAALLAGPAAAQDIRVPVAGKDDAAARAEIRRAASVVCRAADRDGAFQGAYRLQNCLMDAQSRAVFELKAYRLAAARSAEAARSGAAGVAR